MRTIRNAAIVIIMTVMLLNAEVVFGSFIISEPVKKQITYEDLTINTKKQINCLADNIYFEARSEDENGKKAIAYTTLNRLEDGRWSDSICGVVKQKIGKVCQFSWICDKSLRNHKRDYQLYEECRNIAVNVYINYKRNQDDVTGGATFYHADYISPNWSKLTYIKTIGRHLFYRT